MHDSSDFARQGRNGARKVSKSESIIVHKNVGDVRVETEIQPQRIIYQLTCDVREQTVVGGNIEVLDLKC